MIRAPRPAGRREFPTPNPAPRRGSPLRRTGSGAGDARLCLPQALERTCGRWRIKGSLRRATPALDPSPTTNSGCLITHSIFKRGLLYRNIRDHPSRIAFTILASLVFALAHWEQGPHVVVGAAFYNVVACFWFFYFGTLWPIVAGHVLVDLVAFS